MAQAEDVRELSKDCHTVGKIFFVDNVPREDYKAEIVVFKDKVGLKFDVSDDIENIKRKNARDVTPTDRSRCEAHILRCIDECYIHYLIKIIVRELATAQEQIESIWFWEQSYAYRIENDRHVRLILLEYNEHKEDGLYVAKTMEDAYNARMRTRRDLPEYRIGPNET